MEKARCTAIILAAGTGKRMGGGVPKQYRKLLGKPVLYYSLMAFQRSKVVDDIILVARSERLSFCQKRIVERYGFTKVGAVVEGGAQRYDSVDRALKILPKEGYVLIHDAVRPFVNDEIITRAFDAVLKTKAVVVAMPSKDTVKLSDGNGNVACTLKRDKTWIVQTPQAFENHLIRKAYAELMQSGPHFVTDDATAVESFTNATVHLVVGSYDNIKITTLEDFWMAQTLARRKFGKRQD